MHSLAHFKSALLAGVTLACFNLGSLQAEQPLETLFLQEEALIDHVTKSIENAERGISQLNGEILNIEGMSSPIIRHFLNNVCSLKDARYLEIGCWKGSTLVSAAYKNETTLSDIVAIDNWSEFGGPKEQFLWNIRSYINTAPLKFYEKNSFTIDKSQVFHQPINIYFYDGDHSFEAQKAAFTFYDSVLDNVFITFIDDWNWDYVRKGTFAAFDELGYEVLYERAFISGTNSNTSSWWNGFYIAVIKKAYKFSKVYRELPSDKIVRYRGKAHRIKAPYPVTYSERLM